MLLALCTSLSYAQETIETGKVTTFLGIPIDGSKSEMIRKLQEKGYQYNKEAGVLTGEYNGEDVYIFIHTNNNKVWRLAIADVLRRSESQIRIRFNNLCSQFAKNKRYGSSIDQTIPDTEDISYQMLVHNKNYQASYFQDIVYDNTQLDLSAQNRYVWFTIIESHGEYYITMFYENKSNEANGEDL